MDTLPFIPDSYWGNLVMWTLLFTCGVSLFSSKTRPFVWFLAAYWVCVRGLVSIEEIQPYRYFLSTVAHLGFSFICLMYLTSSLPGKIFFVLSVGMLATSATRMSGVMLQQTAEVAFDVTILLQLLVVFLWSGTIGCINLHRSAYRTSGTIRNLSPLQKGGDRPG